MKSMRAGWMGLLLAACVSTSEGKPVPAVLIGVDAASRADLQRVVAQALARASILLADDALTRSSDLIIEPVRPRDTAGRLLNGREQRPPEHFQLLLDGTRCYLRQESTGHRFLLAAAHCAASAEHPPAR